MPRARRYIKAHGVYEVTIRAKDSLPFPCTRVMEAIIYSVLARVQREHKVVLHHLIVEVSHIHIVFTALDACQCQRFYGELKKQLTDAIKRLTGIEHLNLWEVRANLSEVPTLEDAIEKIAYLYTNPSNDNLTSCIEDYPGVSTWSVFRGAPKTIDVGISSSYEWFQQPMIPRLPSRSVSARQDRVLLNELISQAKSKHVLTIHPNAWLSRFIDNPTSRNVEAANQSIISRVREVEGSNAKRRKALGQGIVGASALRSQPLLKRHVSKKQGRRIFVQSKHKEIRLALIREMKLIENLCIKAYRSWAKGDFKVCWPPGTFPPPLPPMASSIQYS